MQRLRAVNHTVPEALQAQILTAGSAIVPDLLTIREATLADDETDHGWTPSHAAKLLGQLGGAQAVPSAEEMRRLGPVLPAAVTLGVPVSIDTMKGAVAKWALEAGAAIVNDVWGLQRESELARIVAESAVPVIIMHNREAADPSIDIMADISAFFRRSLEIAAHAGIARQNIVLDPGIGFGKTPEQSLTAIARIGELKSFGLPLLVGASRKRFIDKVSPAAPDERLGGSIAAHLLAVLGGAAIIRTHDVRETVQALRVAAAIRSAQ